jgi:hypothetical protein
VHEHCFQRQPTLIDAELPLANGSFNYAASDFMRHLRRGAARAEKKIDSYYREEHDDTLGRDIL